MKNTTKTTTKKLPTHDVFVVDYRQGRAEPRKHRISSGWVNKDNLGVNIIINGTIYAIRKRKPNPESSTKNLPTHDVFVVCFGKDQGEPQWHRISAGWEQADTNDINTTINGIQYIVSQKKAFTA